MSRQVTFNPDTSPVPREVINAMEIQGMESLGAFGPGSPIYPTQPIGSSPRQYEYMIGQNIVQRPRSNETVSFDTMRSIIEMYDVAQMCIEVRQDELRNLLWDIVPKDKNDNEATKKYADEIKKIRNFFEHPNPDMLFDDLQTQLCYDWLAYDALTLTPELTKGGKLGALWPVDGCTITPMVDYYGRTPSAPAPAYLQWAYGMPWVWLDKDKLIYRPHRRRNNKLYGYPAIEWLLSNVNTDIRYQLYFLQYFTEGSVPETWINAPESINTAQQIREFQTMYDAVMAGDQSQKHKVKFIPFGSKITQAKDTNMNIDFPKYLLTKSCAAFKVTPAEIGFTERVNKSSGESQENVQYRRSIKPSAKYFESIYNGIIQKYFHSELRFKYLNVEEQEDQLLMAQSDDYYIRNGTISSDEIRTLRFGMNVNEKKPTPRCITIGSVVMPVEDIDPQSKASIAETKSKSVQAKQVTNNPPRQPSESSPIEPVKGNKEVKKGTEDFFTNPREH